MPERTRDQQLAEAFAEISRVLLAEPDVQRTLDKMCALLVETVDGCEHAVVTLVTDHDLESPAASDAVGPAVDAIQLEVDEGPCVEAIKEHHTVVTDDLTTEMRWPRFSRRAVETTGVRSMLAFRMFLAADTLGSLNLYSKHPQAFTEESLAVGTIFAAHASVALQAARTREDLARARSGRGQGAGRPGQGDTHGPPRDLVAGGDGHPVPGRRAPEDRPSGTGPPGRRGRGRQRPQGMTAGTARRPPASCSTSQVSRATGGTREGEVWRDRRGRAPTHVASP